MVTEHKLVRLDLTKLIDLKEPVNNSSLLGADNDLQAVQKWIERFKNTHTVRAYKRDVTRFLLWLSFVKGKHLNEILLDDLQDYLKFLQAPTNEWCVNKTKLKRYDARWRPFSKPLSKSSIVAMMASLQSLFSFLEDADYINKNPLRLLKTQSIIGSIQTQKYNVFARMLENDEWDVVLKIIRQLPTDTEQAQQYKVKINLLFSMLYILGLRIEEAATSVWSNFRKLDGKWWFFIQGKGDKLGHIPANDALMEVVKNFRVICKLSDNVENDDSFIFNNEKGANLSSRTLYNYVKKIGFEASLEFTDKIKKNKLQALSPHWLRHLSASHQNKIGVPITMIRENHRHTSINTTQIYMHSEDEARHAIMQEHNIAIEPVVILEKQQYILSITLLKGPLDKSRAKKLIRNSIESSILVNATLLEEHEQKLIYKTNIDIEQHEIDRIKMLCKIWMFDPVIEVVAI